MSFDAEKEVTKLWRGLHGAQDEIGRTYYRWRKAALEVAGDGVEPLDVGLKTAEIMGEEIGIKLSHLEGKIVNVQPEYSDCQKLARKKNLPLKEVTHKVLKAYFNKG